MEISTIIKLLIKRAWVLILIPVIAGVSAFIFTLYSPKTYKSTAKLATSFTTNERIKITDEQSSLRDSGVKFNNMVTMMTGELILSLLSYELIIHDLSTENPFRTNQSDNNILLGKTKDEIDEIVVYFKNTLEKMEPLNLYNEYENQLIKLLKQYKYAPWILGESLSINRIKATDFVAVNYLSENPDLSAFVVNMLCKQYIRYDSAQAVDLSSRSVVFFTDLVSKKKKLLDEKTDSLNTYKAENNLFSTNQILTGSSQILTLEGNKREQLNRIQRLTMSIANVQKQLDKKDNYELNPTNSSKARIIILRDSINNLNRKLISEGSNNQELESEIILLRQLLRSEMEKIPAVSSNSANSLIKSKEELMVMKDELQLELEIEKATLQTLNRTIRRLKNNMSATEQKEVSVASLEMEEETASKEYLQAVQKLNLEKSKALISNSPIQIIQMGQPNNYPESYKRKLIVGLALMSSFSICVFIILIIEYSDLSVKTPSKFRAITGLELLGPINLINTGKPDLKEIINYDPKKAKEGKNQQFIRKIRYEIENLDAKVILFTSTKEGEGKTFLILSVAYSLGLLNKKILIIDTNFKNNALSNLLIDKSDFSNSSSDESEGHIWVGSSNKMELEKKNISHTSNNNIDIIGNQLQFGSPSELFATTNFKDLVNDIIDSYDYIFMEGASLNEYSDSKELVEYVDKVIPIFSATSVIKPIDHESIDYLKSLNGKLMGSILNMVDPNTVE